MPTEKVVSMDSFELVLSEVTVLNPLIQQFVLRAADGRALPGFSAGAHIQVQVKLPDGSQDWRHYSLINAVADSAATQAPTHYQIAVRREEAGRGGSQFMHRLQAGDKLLVQAPKNDFPLADSAAPTLLIAGGIGVTPLLSMAADLCARQRPVRMQYAARSRALLAYDTDLQALLGANLALHIDEEAGAPLDIGALLDGCAADEQVYVCGPKPMLDAVLAAAQARNWPQERVHFELFTPVVEQEGDHAFEVVLAQSGLTYQVAANQSILDCLIENGFDAMYDCQRGECGVCAVSVLEGEIDHRDYVLSAREKAEGTVMQMCISRAKGHRLVLDL